MIIVGLGLAFFSTALPYSLQFKALKHLSPRAFGVLLSIEPAIAVLIGFTLLGEQMELHTLVAITLIIVAAIGVTLFKRS